MELHVRSKQISQKLNFVMAISFLIFAISACSADNESSVNVNSDPSADVTQTKDSNCKQASPELLNNIAFLAQDGTGLDPISGYYIKSKDFASVYFVAMEFSATGIDNQVGVWVSNKVDGSNSIQSVDGTAKAFTDWFHSDETDANITISDPSVSQVLNCFK